MMPSNSVSKPMDNWEEYEFRRLQKLNSCFIITKLGGTCDFPCRIFRGNTSRAYKIYANLLCVISLGFTIQSFVFFFLPSAVPDTYMILKNDKGPIARYTLPLWSIATTSLRFALVKVLHEESFSQCIREVLWDLTNDLRLRDHGLSLNDFPKCLAIPVAFFALCHCSFITFWLWKKSGALYDPIFYLSVLELFLYHTSFETAALHIGLLTFKEVLPLLRQTNQQFLAAVESVDASLLQEAIACHDKCWNLIKCIDRIAGFFMGICLTMAIPTTVITVSFLDTIREELLSFYTLILWVISFFGSIGFLTYVTGSIHTAAHFSDEILTRKVYSCAVFRDNASQFRARFGSRSMGYTYFGFATFRKETLLTILNLVATYVVVGFQLRAGVFPKQSSCLNSPINESRSLPVTEKTNC